METPKDNELRRQKTKPRARVRGDPGQKAETSTDGTINRERTHIKSGTQEPEQAVIQPLSAEGTGTQSKPGIRQLRKQQAPFSLSHKCQRWCYKHEVSMPRQGINEPGPSGGTLQPKYENINHGTRESQRKEHWPSKEGIEEMRQ